MTRSFEILSEFLLIKGTSDIIDKGRMDYCRFFDAWRHGFMFDGFITTPPYFSDNLKLSALKACIDSGQNPQNWCFEVNIQ